MSFVVLHVSSSRWYFSFRSCATFPETAKPMGGLFVFPASVASESALPCKAIFPLCKRQLLNCITVDLEDKLYFRARCIEMRVIPRFSGGL